MKRRVNFSTLFGLFKSNQPYGILSIIFICIAIFLVPFVFLIQLGFKGENDNYDFNNIKKYGVKTDGVITYIDTQKNLTINEQNPVILSYEYKLAGKKLK